MVRVITYIDGFNLYFGMTEKKKDTKWLDLQKLSSNLLKPDQVLVKTKYFTSRISEQNTNKARRQQKEVLSLDEASLLKVFYLIRLQRRTDLS